MKIKCTKEVHAELVARCHEKANCGGCVLENVCKMYEQDAEKKSYQRLTELVEIEYEDEEDKICRRSQAPLSGMAKYYRDSLDEAAALKFAPFKEIEAITNETAESEAPVRE